MMRLPHAARTGATKTAVFHSFLEAGLQAFDDGVGLPERTDVRQTLRTVQLDASVNLHGVH